MRRGSNYEDMACKYLRGLGYEILTRNYYCGFGELDLVAREGDELVFVEVKGGVDEEFGHPAQRLTPKKFDRIVRCAFRFLEENSLDLPFRIDLIVILGGKVEHYKNVSFW